MNSIEIKNVNLDYSIYSVRAQSLKNSMINIAVGGKLFKSRGDITVIRALQNVSFKIVEGDRLALVGHNGSGKTTLLKVVAGVYHPSSGGVRVQGAITSMIAVNAGLDPEDTGLQNIKKLGLMRQLPSKLVQERIPAIVEFSGLGHYIQLPVKTYSAGMLARLSFAMATEFDPEILVLDEWLSAGDADFIGKAAKRMDDLVKKASIMVLATHDPALVQRVCNKVCVLDAGKIVYFGSPEGYYGSSGHAAVG